MSISNSTYQNRNNVPIELYSIFSNTNWILNSFQKIKMDPELFLVQISPQSFKNKQNCPPTNKFPQICYSVILIGKRR